MTAKRGTNSGRDQRLNALIEEEGLVQSVANAIATVLKDDGISRATLAKRLGVSAPNVTQILRGDNNLKLKTVARIAYALGMRVTVGMERLKARPSVVTQSWKHCGRTEWPEPKLKLAGRR
jgi:transcriptional regulator with XRE-family HTH domain